LDEYFSGIPNRVLTALARITLPAYEIRVLLAIWRNVWGWKGREGWFTSSGKIARSTGLSRAKAHEALYGRTVKGKRQGGLALKRLLHITPRSNGIFIVPSREPAEWIIPEKDRATRERQLPLGPLDIRKSVPSTGNTLGDKVFPIEGAAGVPSMGSTGWLETLDRLGVSEALKKKVLNKVLKERASG